MHEIGVFILEARFHGQLDAPPAAYRLGFDVHALDEPPQAGQQFSFRFGIAAVDHKHIGDLTHRLIGEDQEHHPHHQGAGDPQEKLPRAGDDAGRDSPENVYDIDRVFDGGPEPDNAQGADHAQGEDDVRGHRHDDQGGDHGHGHQGDVEIARIHHSVEGFLVDGVDEQAQEEGDQEADRHVHQGEAGHRLFEHVILENVSEIKGIAVWHGLSSVS